MFSSGAIKHYITLIVFSFLVALALTGTSKLFPDYIPRQNIFPLTAGFAIIAMTSMMVFFGGMAKNPEKSVFATWIAIGLKMILSFIIALLFIVVFKNREMRSVILFFVLYLSFTLYVFLTFFNVLKKNSGNKD